MERKKEKKKGEEKKKKKRNSIYLLKQQGNSLHFKDCNYYETGVINIPTMA